MRVPHALVLSELSGRLTHGRIPCSIVAAVEAPEIFLGLEQFQKVRNVFVVCPDLSRASAFALVQGAGATLDRRSGAAFPTTQVIIFGFAATSCREFASPVTKAAAVACYWRRFW